MVIDTTEFKTDKQQLEYIQEIQNITGNIPYILTSPAQNSKFQGTAKQLQRQLTQDISHVRFGETNLFVINAAQLFDQKQLPQKISKQTQKDLKEIALKSKFNIVVISRPLYCSALNDQCTSECTLVKSSYLDTITDLIKTDLVISGNAQFYERTFPKYEHNHIGQEDLHQFNKSEMPIFINVNGGNLIAKDDKWALQKQQWSAQLRVKQTFGMLTLKSDNSLVFNAFNSKGQEIDEVTIHINVESDTESGMFLPVVLILLLASIIPLAYVGLISTFVEFYQPYYKLLVEGKPIPIVQECHNQPCSQHQRLRTNDSDEGANIEVQMSDFSIVGGPTQRGSFGSSGLTHRRPKMASTQDSNRSTTDELERDEENKEEIANPKISKSKKKK